MEDKPFKSVSLRTTLLQQVQDFIDKHPEFITENPESNSVAGFIDKATRTKLQELKSKEV